MELVMVEIILSITVLGFVGIGVWALLRKTPMSFWAGTKVDPATVTDIKKYNRANAIMWFCYCIPLVVSMVAAPYSISLAGRIAGIGIVAGLGVLILAYLIIRTVFKNKYNSPHHQSNNYR